ncbi:MAG: heterodisulfide reductase subunit B [Candidatus Competibacteraceae bacterium]|nr:MAG: heterodisulfide reductase subunit B [Candidatus Competibacteraceae bacterium]
MRIGYYPGCSLKSSAREYEESVRALCAALDLELVEIPDWNCCGASSAHVMSADLALGLRTRNLAQAEAAGLDEVLTPCAACFSHLAEARMELADNPNKRQEVADFIGLPYSGRVRVLNVLAVLDRYRDRIAAKVKNPFRYKVACYYGCLLVRPPEVVQFDRPENPQSMDRLLEAVGAKPIPWACKTECCGASFSVTRTDVVANLSGRIVADAVKRNAAAIVVACPMCQSNLDLRRPEINQQLEQEHGIPVLYITQALGLALGIDPQQLGLQRHLVPVELPEPEPEVVTADDDDDDD